METKIQKYCRTLVEEKGILNFYDLKDDEQSKALSIFWDDNIFFDSYTVWCELIDVSGILVGFHKKTYDEKIVAAMLLEKTNDFAIREINLLLEELHEDKLFEERNDEVDYV